MTDLIPVIDQAELHRRITCLAQTLSADYQGRELVVIGVLKGAFIFVADLVRLLDIKKITIDFVQASSYGADTVSSEKIVLKKDIDIDIYGKNVLLVDDIVDTGLTLAFLINHLNHFAPREIRVCALVDNRARRKADVRVDYTCMHVHEGFLVGYGLDYAEDYRNLPEIYHMKQ